MRKTLFLLVALFLTMNIGAENALSGTFEKSYFFSKDLIDFSVVLTPEPSKIALEEDERIMGFYTTDNLGNQSVALKKAGKYSAGALFPLDITKYFVTGKITKVRFALAAEIGPSQFRIYGIKVGEKMKDPLVTIDVPATREGWNDVSLQEPIVIEDNVNYFFVYDFEQEAEQKIVVLDSGVNQGEVFSGGFMISDGEGFLDMGTQYGHLCIQAVVKGGKIIDDDVEISDLILEKTLVKKGNLVNFQCKIKNVGDKLPESYKVKATFNGEEIKLNNLPMTLNATKQTITGSIATADLKPDGYVLEINVEEINGVKPTQNTDNDKLSAHIGVFENSFSRQKQIIEQFTSQYCTYCPDGERFVNALCNLRDDIAVVAIHGDMGDAKDVFATADGNRLLDKLNIGFPSAAFNRYFWADEDFNPTGGIAMGIGFENSEGAARVYNEEVVEMSVEEIPALATIAISTAYDAGSRSLKITVSGDVVQEFKSVLGDKAVLTVCLTEDGLIGQQLDHDVLKNDYLHNNVYRKAVSKPLGDQLEWIGDAKYKNSYELSLSEEWKAENMNVVAYISQSIDEIAFLHDAGILNGEKVRVTVPSDISNTVAGNGEVAEVARYTIDGRMIANPVKGFNLVKMSDGSTIKEYIR